MDLFNNRLIIERTDGTIIKDVPCSIQKQVYIKDLKIPIAEGDVMVRELPSGITERLLVTNVTTYNMGTQVDHMEINYTKI